MKIHNIFTHNSKTPSSNDFSLLFSWYINICLRSTSRWNVWPLILWEETHSSTVINNQKSDLGNMMSSCVDQFLLNVLAKVKSSGAWPLGGLRPPKPPCFQSHMFRTTITDMQDEYCGDCYDIYIIQSQYTKVAAFGRQHKRGDAAFDRATSFVVSFVLAVNNVHIVAVTTILVLHVGNGRSEHVWGAAGPPMVTSPRIWLWRAR